ncbi:cytochrome-c oxidase, cbb3-type subunit II [Empedobacter falsenii]|uniref:Cytochrome-c oxidase, cbb3-type subunit II n=3 Tax=Empedobacter TaxID=59734 RepID=A0ABY8V7Q9_9FLAO|nr:MULTISPECIES: cytochrome-c oxidase, cbb3-type subunit II [Empedobacter]MCA4783013.1 cytochrome-c oxidase, cbb3-type subunit II [Empedobacter stercoris]MDM1522616.1 cytochrome-c oxidase, cbb3-type subunit II [Empedobacter sp. 225-1]NOJ76553.1 cytochrome-c oxidase, cbb3-type subunit II [Empedobacter stercoris]WIH96643.1 cytochrome-c oxidase, cbb3-type subunit II [Empedobacter falsenii]HJD87682.1 cytochrome-c oxidase, cbb3-type subunit II [Empedobacter falsenii]
MQMQTFSYDNKIVKYFLYATLFWAVMAFFFGVLVATLLFFPTLPEYIFGSDDGTIGGNIQGLINSQGTLGFGRLRMIHTTFAVFAFVGNSFFTGAYYSMQRLLKTRMYSDVLSWIVFWGWQLFIVLSFVTFILGYNTSKEYAEHEWPIDILIALVWVLFGAQMFLTIAKRRVRHLYVAIWFYIGTWAAITMLHVFNNLEIPVTFSLTAPKSYSLYSGVQDALVQWWYGHNAVAFFLTTPILGLMYYFVPKAANRPVFSYKLSIVHFWSLIFIYIWAGPHHLLYTALPGWAQALGTGFSIMLIAPSWGGMLNGLLTLRGAWDKVRENPILKFFVVALTCYGMATFEGPLLATKTLNKIGHFTDWVPAHVHVGTLGWNGFIAFGMIYYLVPKLFGTKLASVKMANAHFWIGTFGILFWVIPMYVAGWTQGLMWKQFAADGTLEYGNFLQTVTILKQWLYPLRAFGGTLYLIGSILMVINVWKTVKSGSFIANEEAEAPALAPKTASRTQGEGVHSWIERTPIVLTIGAVLTLAVGGLVEIVPTIVVKSNVPTISSVKPYTPLELEGRDLYIREGCNACHTQMIRPFRDEVKRYGEYSKAGEFVYDYPFLWGSKRTGPDLHREGGKNPDAWHYKHMWNPRSTSDGSIMPRYPWLIENKLDRELTRDKMKSMVALGVPYEQEDFDSMQVSMNKQALAIETSIFKDANDLKDLYAKKEAEAKAEGKEFVPLRDREITALIAYLQRLGTDISAEQVETASN